MGLTGLCHPLQEVCVSRMLAGSRLYQGLLGVLSNRLSGLSDLQADLRDLHTHISKVTHTHADMQTHCPAHQLAAIGH